MILLIKKLTKKIQHNTGCEIYITKAPCFCEGE